MATLVLTTVGSLIGGPIGGAIGALIGSGVDRSLFGSTRQGPRLGDLAVQTSTYGSALPKIFGTMRVAGTVIWATDLREDSHSSGSAKAGTKTTSYSYSANFAVALSARPIAGVGRIWADGKLLRGSAGDWKTETGFRLHLGDEDQDLDPLIASAEGLAAAPAHRGIAYAVFEGMQLADYGNRIPSLTFEVMADEGAVSPATIAADLSGGAISGAIDATLGGYAASGESVRAALETLARVYSMALADDGAQLVLQSPVTTEVDPALLGAAAGEARSPATMRDRRAAATLPNEIALSYYDPDRDYQAGLQRARRDGIGLRGQAIDLPASLSAGAAKGLAEGLLGRAWIGREGRTAHLPWRAMAVRAGEGANIDGERFRIAGWSLEKMALSLDLARETAATLPASATPGRAAPDGDAPAGATVLALVDLPGLGDALADAPQLWLAAAGTGAGWRRAEASLSLDDGASWQAMGRTALPAVMGSAAGALAAGTTMLVDRVTSVDIDLLHGGMALAGASIDAMIGSGANAALLGDEIIQFGSVSQIGAIRWRLSMLLRGRRGTEWAVGGHVAGERFLLLDQASLLAVPVPVAALGTMARVSAIGPADGGAAVEIARTIDGWALRPPPPVALTAARLGDGTIRFGWTRRSRQGWAWLDGTDAPLGEAGELYRLEIRSVAGAPRIVEVGVPAYDYSPADQAADGASGAITLAVTQLGTRASSMPPASATWIL